MANRNSIGKEMCQTIIQSNTDENVSRVLEVYLPHATNWTQLLSRYEFVKNKLISQFGNPTTCIERFKGTNPNNGEELLFVREGKCVYMTEFVFRQGKIGIQIICAGGECSVAVSYEDYLNSKNKHSSTLENKKSTRASNKNRLPYDDDNHIAFWGIPINGRLSDFANSFKANNKIYEIIIDRSDIFYYVTKHPKTQEKCIVSAMEYQGVIFSANEIYFTNNETWDELLRMYNEHCSRIENYYGKPQNVSTGFKYAKPSKGSEYQAVINKESQYFSIFPVPGGRIRVVIETIFNEGCVLIQYYDRNNESKVLGK